MPGSWSFMIDHALKDTAMCAVLSVELDRGIREVEDFPRKQRGEELSTRQLRVSVKKGGTLM